MPPIDATVWRLLEVGTASSVHSPSALRYTTTPLSPTATASSSPTHTLRRPATVPVDSEDQASSETTSAAPACPTAIVRSPSPSMANSGFVVPESIGSARFSAVSRTAAPPSPTAITSSPTAAHPLRSASVPDGSPPQPRMESQRIRSPPSPHAAKSSADTATTSETVRSGPLSVSRHSSVSLSKPRIAPETPTAYAVDRSPAVAPYRPRNEAVVYSGPSVSTTVHLAPS